MDKRMEREYRGALDGLRFSREEKERMMKNLVKLREEPPVKRWHIRPLRAGLIAAAMCAALVGTAFAATAALRQANIHFFHDWDEYVQAQREKSQEDGVDYGITIGYVNRDYSEASHLDMDAWWNGEEQARGGACEITAAEIVGAEQGQGGFSIVTGTQDVVGAEVVVPSDPNAPVFQTHPVVQTLVEEAAGTAEDGWTAKRVFQCEVDGRTYLTAKYKAEALSGYDSLWSGWDTSWLEERYTPVPGSMWCEAIRVDGNPHQASIFGEFRGEGDTIFNLQYSWNSEFTYGDENEFGSMYDYTGHYVTADGVTAAIKMDTSHTGKSLFWVTVPSGGHGMFSMFGTQVELDELHAILDSLNLARVLEYSQYTEKPAA